MSRQVVIEAQNLTKAYDSIIAVNGLNLRVEEGEIFGFLGPNGAGKTTTILMLLGLTDPTSGTARVCGYDSTREALKVKRISGYLPENVGFYEDMTARENLRYIAELNRIPDKQASKKIDEVLEIVGLASDADRRVEEYSKGMKQRLGIADVLIKEPKVAFLDEPTMGIDPDGVSRVLDIIVSMSRDRGITILLSSHLLHQVQRICHRVGILSKGKLVAEGPIARLGREALKKQPFIIEVVVPQPSPQLVDSLRRIVGVAEVERSGDLLTVGCKKDVRAEICRVVVQSGSPLLQMKTQEYALEEIYMRYFHEG